MTVAAYPYAIDLQLPWQEDEQQNARFKRLLKRLVIPLLLLFLIIPWLPTVAPEYEERELDIVKTEIILEPVIIEPEATPEPVAPKQKPKPVEQPLQKKSDKPKTAKQKEKDKKKKTIAESQGLTAISSELNSLRQSLDLTKLQKKNVSTSQGGEVARSDASVLGEDQLTQKSQGIVVDDSVMKRENVALAAHQSTSVDGFLDDGAPISDSSNFYSNIQGTRSTESIRRVLEAGKGRAYMDYQRALRDAPGLAGVLVFELVIEADGKVSALKLVSSELASPDLEKKILAHIQKLDFGAEDVSPRKVQYKFNFLPN